MDAFRNKRRVTFQALQRIPDGAGGWSEDWTASLTVWGQYSPERGRERIQHGRLASTLAGVLRIRSSTDARQITTEHRVLVNNIAYNIRSIANPDQRDDMIELTIET